MPKFVCSYAYDVPCFADFTVEAESEAQALRLCKAAFAADKFNDVQCEANWGNDHNHRVFVQGEAADYSPDTTLGDLIGEPEYVPDFEI